MTQMPGIWIFLCRDWLHLPRQLAWSWWQALGKSPWSACVELRKAVVRYAAHPYPDPQEGTCDGRQ
jgi:hypothetical protein